MTHVTVKNVNTFLKVLKVGLFNMDQGICVKVCYKIQTYVEKNSRDLYQPNHTVLVTPVIMLDNGSDTFL